MEKLNLWSKMVASVLVISAVVSLIIPDSGIKKAFNTLVSTILVFALIYPLSAKSISLKPLTEFIESIGSGSSEEVFNDYSELALISSAESEVKKYVEEIDRECQVEVICDYKDGKVQIEKISITGNINTEKKYEFYNKIIKICDDGTVIEFNGDRYERKH